jgi:hypothetical protein
MTTIAKASYILSIISRLHSCSSGHLLNFCKVVIFFTFPEPATLWKIFAGSGNGSLGGPGSGVGDGGVVGRMGQDAVPLAEAQDSVGLVADGMKKTFRSP